jgi:tetratricopeptide (TPR) repeat protein
MAETDEKINAEAATFFKQGKEHNAHKRYGAAIEAYTKATELKPDFAEAFNNRGIAYGNKGDYDKAIADYTEAVRLNPNFAEAFCTRGNTYAQKGDYDKAIADYTEAVRLKPNDASAFLNRGIAYSDTGDHGRAIADYNEAIRLQPDYAEAFNNRGGAYGKKGEHDKAIADFGEAIRLKPKNAKAFNNRGVAYGNKGDYGKAIADYTEAIRLQPDLAEAFCARGNTYTSKGDYDKAIADYDEAIRLQPDYALAFFGRGFAYSSKGNHDKAIADCDEAVRLKSDYALAFFGRGFAYRNKGDYSKAIADYNEATRLQPDLAARASYQDIVWKIAPDDLWNYETETLVKFRHFFARFIVVCKKKGTDSEAHKELVRALHSLWKACFFDEFKPEVADNTRVYQYTDVETFEKMFRSRALRLAPAAYQNDSEKGKVFFAEIERILKKDKTHPLLLKAVQELKTYSAEESITYIRSFSEEADGIVMWNSSYGHSGEGVAVGIDRRKLKGGFGAGDVFRKTQNDGEKADEGKEESQNLKLDQTGLYKVLYVKKGGEKKGYDERLKKIADCLKKLPPEDFEDKEFLDSLSRLVAPISHLIKHDYFRHEKEYRLIHTVEIKTDANYIKSAAFSEGIYIDTEPVLFKKKPQTEDDKIWVGPKVNPVDYQKNKTLV